MAKRAAPLRLLTDEQVELLPEIVLRARLDRAHERCLRYQSGRSRGYRRAYEIWTQALRELKRRGIDPRGETMETEYQTQAPMPVIDAIQREVGIAFKWTTGVALNHLEVKQMADGSGRWAVFSTLLDAEDHEHVQRVVFNDDGSIESAEEVEP